MFQVEFVDTVIDAIFGQQVIGSVVQMNLLLTLGVMGLAFLFGLVTLIVLLRK